MKNFTVISDPGIDDLVALVILWKLFPQAGNSLITTFGNATEEITSRNGKEFISFVANSWGFVHGANLPLNGRVERPWPDYFHGLDGVWGIHPPVDTKSIQSLEKCPVNDDIISLAPMRDTLTLLQNKTGKNFAIMGGAFNIEGNETKYAETNIAFDPDSAADFFNSCKDTDVKVVPLDVTRKVFWDINTVKHIPENNNVNIWLKKLLLTWFDKYDHEREKSFNLHDPLAVYLLFNPREANWKKSGIKVITDGEQRGRTILSDDNPLCQIALDLDNPSRIAERMFNIVFS